MPCGRLLVLVTTQNQQSIEQQYWFSFGISMTIVFSNVTCLCIFNWLCESCLDNIWAHCCADAVLDTCARHTLRMSRSGRASAGTVPFFLDLATLQNKRIVEAHQWAHSFCDDIRRIAMTKGACGVPAARPCEPRLLVKSDD